MNPQGTHVICPVCESRVMFVTFGCPACGFQAYNGKVKGEITSKASEISGWLQDAVGDMAGHDDDTVDMNLSLNSEWKKKVDKARKNGVGDVPGWLADEYYNDVAILKDLSGDRIYDASSDCLRAGDLWNPDDPNHNYHSYRIKIMIAKEMQEHAHKALHTALEMLIDDWQRYLKEQWKKQLEAEAAAYGDSQIR